MLNSDEANKNLKFLSYLNQFSILINKLCCVICVILGLLLVSMITLEVFFRYVVGNALSWPEEIAGFVFVWFSMLGAAICLFKKAHVSVMFAVNHFNEKIRFHVQNCIHIVIILFSYILIERGHALLNIVSGQLSAAIQINMVWEYAAMPVTGVIFILYSIVSILNNLFTGNDAIRGDLKS